LIFIKAFLMITQCRIRKRCLVKPKTPKGPAAVLPPEISFVKSNQDSSDLQASEIRYRRLFESAQDGILILDAGTGCISDVNPFMVQLLGRPSSEFLNKQLWEIGLFRDVEKSKLAFRELQRDGYIRYEDMPLETWDGRHIDVEFVSSSYQAGSHRVIQCNIRDITERKYAEVEKALLASIEVEQRRIGQDLHEGLLQQLTGIALIARTLEQGLLTEAPARAATAAEIAELISLAIDQTRDLAGGLSPVEIEVEGLTTALEKFVTTTERLYKISCEFVHDESSGFKHKHTSLAATHIYRIVQEAVNNAIQHGKAKKIVITLAGSRDRKMLTIQDDGIGLPPDAEEKQGLGLRSMRYRGRMIGARFKVSRDAGGGTTVVCSFPHMCETESPKI